jgi:group I intron endonuclease
MRLIESLAGSGIYSIRNTINGKIYVGSAVKLKRRFYEHKSGLIRNAHINIKLQRAWNKYGQEAFVFSVIEHVDNTHDLICREQFWIDHHRDKSPDLYNISLVAGSPLGVKHSEEFKARCVERQLGKKLSPEIRRKISEAHKGRIVTAETRAKIGAKNKNISTEQRGKIRSLMTGVVFSEERKAKIREARARQVMQPRSAATKAKIGAGRKARSVELAKSGPQMGLPF